MVNYLYIFYNIIYYFKKFLHLISALLCISTLETISLAMPRPTLMAVMQIVAVAPAAPAPLAPSSVHKYVPSMHQLPNYMFPGSEKRNYKIITENSGQRKEGKKN